MDRPTMWLGLVGLAVAVALAVGTSTGRGAARDLEPPAARVVEDRSAAGDLGMRANRPAAGNWTDGLACLVTVAPDRWAGCTRATGNAR